MKIEELTLLITAITPLILGYMNKQNTKNEKELKGIKEIVVGNTGHIKDVKKELDSIRERNIVNLKYTLYHDIREYLDIGWIDKKDFVELKALYDEYVQLGGNGTVKTLFEELEQLERKGDL